MSEFLSHFGSTSDGEQDGFSDVLPELSASWAVIPSGVASEIVDAVISQIADKPKDDLMPKDDTEARSRSPSQREQTLLLNVWQGRHETSESVTQRSGLLSTGDDQGDIDGRPSKQMRDRDSSPRRSERLHQVTCKLCDEDVRGVRWLCKECPAWSVCQECIHALVLQPDIHPGHTMLRMSDSSRDTVQLQEPLWPPFYEHGGGGRSARQKRANRLLTLHIGVQCSNCHGSIIGVLYECALKPCRDVSATGTVFCQECEALPCEVHPVDHPLIKYKTARTFASPPIEIPPHVLLSIFRKD